MPRSARAALRAGAGRIRPVEWMKDWMTEVGGIAADRVSGATALTLRGLALLKELALGGEDVARVALALARAQPSMAGFHTIAALTMTAADPAGVVDVLARRTDRCIDAIARQAAAVVTLRRDPSQPLTIVTCSRSAAVEQTLLRVHERERLRVCCAESRPAREGLALAESLTARAVDVELYSDAGVRALPGADGLLVGADALSSAGFINKVGTAALAAAHDECN